MKKEVRAKFTKCTLVLRVLMSLVLGLALAVGLLCGVATADDTITWHWGEKNIGDCLDTPLEYYSSKCNITEASSHCSIFGCRTTPGNCPGGTPYRDEAATVTSFYSTCVGGESFCKQCEVVCTLGASYRYPQMGDYPYCPAIVCYWYETVSNKCVN
jgi:hypothetical protein